MILVIDDDIAVQGSLNLLLKEEGFSVITVSEPIEGFSVIEEQNIKLIILDMNFSFETSGEEGLQTLKTLKAMRPDIPVILMTGWSSIALAVEGMRNGAADFIPKPWENLNLVHVVRTVLNLFNEDEPKPGKSLTRGQLNLKHGFNNIIGEDLGLLEVLKTVGRVSSTEASVLITGESGTGKELIAEAIHANSTRKNGAFVKVNLGGISSALFESEMFGHKRGAFTDANRDRIGRFEMAQNGTIFLDEIGDLDLNDQVKLLRVLQDRTYEVLGDSITKTIDVRIICATNLNLQKMVAEKKFREDLYYRINLIKVHLPTLRERANDIPFLAIHFINTFKDKYKKPNLRIDETALNWLKKLPFPGNIRELKNLLERTVLIADKDLLEIKDFKLHLETYDSQLSGYQDNQFSVDSLNIDHMEASLIKKAMEYHNNNISKVSHSMGLSRGALYRKLEKYNI